MQPKPHLYNQPHKQPFHSAQMLTSEASGTADCPLTSLKILYDRLNHKNTTNNPSDFITCHLLHVLKKILSKSPLGRFTKLWFNRHSSMFRKERWLCSVFPHAIPTRGTKTAATTSWFQAILYNCFLQKNSYYLISKSWYEMSDFCSYCSPWKSCCSTLWILNWIPLGQNSFQKDFLFLRKKKKKQQSNCEFLLPATDYYNRTLRLCNNDRYPRRSTEHCKLAMKWKKTIGK